MLVVWLAVRDLLRDRVFLICNTAILVGVLVPLLLLFGVKNGVYAALVGEMLADPTSRQIDTAGNASFSSEDFAAIRDWPDVAFVTPKVRGQFDFVNVRAKDGRRIEAALMIPSGAGDPTLPEGLDLAPDALAISAALSRQLDLNEGDAIQLITQAEDRPRQLVLEAHVAAVLSDEDVPGRAILAPFEVLDLIEAFYDSYALPAHGIEGSKQLTDRISSYAGVRVYVDRLENLSALQARIEAHLGVATTARTGEVEALLNLGRNLNLALGLTVALAAIGLGAALGVAFWSNVSRKRTVLASIALLGIPGRTLVLFPLCQAMITAVVGLAASYLGYQVAVRVAQSLFDTGLPGGAPLTLITTGQGLMIGCAVLGLLLIVTAAAGWSAQRIDPATILREAV